MSPLSVPSQGTRTAGNRASTPSAPGAGPGPQAAGGHGVEDIGTARPATRLLESLAGFLDEEAEAQQLLQLLRQQHGLGARQLVLLGPTDAGARRFAQAAAQWAPHWSVHGREHGGIDPRAALWLALLTLALGATVWWLMSPSPAATDAGFEWLPGLLLIGLMLVLLAAIGTVVPVLVRPARRVRRFEAGLQRQLASGHWAVVVHRVPAHQQATVLALVRSRSRRWCAVAPEVRRL